MRKLLILTASFGLGHNSVAQAIKDQLVEYDPNNTVEIIDAFELLTPKLKEKYEGIYKLLTDKYPKVYNYVYDLRKNSEDTIFDSLFYEMHKGRLYRYLENEQPDMVISTFPMCSGIVSKIKRKLTKEVPMITVVTDVVDSWEWLHQDTDMYFVPSNEIKEKLMSKDIESDKIKVTGIPVRKEFLKASSSKSNRKQVLIMASAMNNMGITNGTLNQIDRIEDLKIIIVTGSNRKLFNELSSNNYNNIEVLGFTTEMAYLMETSDFIVTKPGGVTLFEAINMEIPLVIKDSGIGQEQANVDYVKEHEIGIYIDETTDILELFEADMINESIIDKMKNNLRRVKETIQPNKLAEYSLEILSS